MHCEEKAFSSVYYHGCNMRVFSSAPQLSLKAEKEEGSGGFIKSKYHTSISFDMINIPQAGNVESTWKRRSWIKSGSTVPLNNRKLNQVYSYHRHRVIEIIASGDYLRKEAISFFDVVCVSGEKSALDRERERERAKSSRVRPTPKVKTNKKAGKRGGFPRTRAWQLGER